MKRRLVTVGDQELRVAEDIAERYEKACASHKTQPVPQILQQLFYDLAKQEALEARQQKYRENDLAKRRQARASRGYKRGPYGVLRDFRLFAMRTDTQGEKDKELLSGGQNG